MTPSPEISAQTFPATSTLAGRAETGLHPSGRVLGNHGFHVSGILGADYDNDSPTGTSPDPAHLLDIRSIPVGGLSWPRMLSEIARHFPASGQFILNTSLGYNDPAFVDFGYVERFHHALHWRTLAYRHYDRFFHATSAGNNGTTNGDGGEARSNSPFAIAMMHDDLRDFVDFTAISASEARRVQRSWEFFTTLSPETASRTLNGLVVGNTHTDGTRFPTSSRSFDVATQGAQVLNTCVAVASSISGCDRNNEGLVRFTGTSQATPQIAGLAAYMWNLQPTLAASIDRTRSIIKHAYDNSDLPSSVLSNALLVDAYMATLALDKPLATWEVRETILDQRQPAGFDEVDLEAFVDAFEFYRNDRATNGTPNKKDFSRFDLNGDGITGGSNPSRFDLDVSATTPAWTIVSKDVEGTLTSFDENAVTDSEILLYYAYSDLWSTLGDEGRRRDIVCESLLKHVENRASTSYGKLQCQSPTVVTTQSRSSVSAYCGPFDCEDASYRVEVDLVDWSETVSCGVQCQRPGGEVAAASASASASVQWHLDAQSGEFRGVRLVGDAFSSSSASNGGNTFAGAGVWVDMVIAAGEFDVRTMISDASPVPSADCSAWSARIDGDAMFQATSIVDTVIVLGPGSYTLRMSCNSGVRPGTCNGESASLVCDVRMTPRP